MSYLLYDPRRWQQRDACDEGCCQVGYDPRLRPPAGYQDGCRVVRPMFEIIDDTEDCEVDPEGNCGCVDLDEDRFAGEGWRERRG